MTRISAELRALVRQRASSYCEYCGRPETRGEYPFHVDHIHALKHGGASSANNLAWACFQCNTAKGSNIASIDPVTGTLTTLFHPRRQQWRDHFRFEGGYIVGLTPEGRVTVLVLRMNEPQDVEIRERHLRRGQWGLPESSSAEE